LITGLALDDAIARVSRVQGLTQMRTYVSDALGSVLAQTTQAQAVDSGYAYSPYGETMALGVDATGSPIQYTGRENDGTGLYFYRMRYYDPVLKRFISRDPIGLAGGMNEFGYVGGDPISRIDPSGLAATVVAQQQRGGGYSFYAFGDGRAGAISGTLNTSTFNVNQLGQGTYSVSPRPELNTPWWNPFSQINANRGRPSISNTNDWNTVVGADGSITRGAQFHAGRNGGSGGVSRACMVSDQDTYSQLNSLFQMNYQNGGVTLMIFPAGWMGP